MTDPLPAGRAIHTPVSTPDQVAGETKRKRRNRPRTRNATILRRINALSRERQEAWAGEHHLSLEEFRRAVETGQRDLTRVLTSKLDRSFDDVRRTDRPQGEDYRGKTSGVRG